MSYRLQVLVPEELELKIRKAAQRRRVSKSQWVRRAIEDALRSARHPDSADPVARLASLNGPTSDIDRPTYLAERAELRLPARRYHTISAPDSH